MQQLVLVFMTTLFYGLVYSAVHQSYPEAFGFKSVIDPFYFAFTTMSTVGYGDYRPNTDMAKMIVMSQQFIIMGEILSAIDFSKKGLRFKLNKLP